MTLWHNVKEDPPKDKQEVLINTSIVRDKYGVCLSCNCQYNKKINSWKILDDTFLYAGDEKGYLPCKDTDSWCIREEYDALVKEHKKQQREAKKLKNKQKK